MLTHRLPDSMVRSFADDTAMVAHNIWRDGTGILQTFDEFERMTHLKLNLSKIFIPLFPSALAPGRLFFLTDAQPGKGRRLQVQVLIWDIL